MPRSSKSFNPLQIPLDGVHSINASAGTGKTYTITTLYLRYLLEAHCSVEQILVTTFTEAATAELRDRLRHRLGEALGILREAKTATAAKSLVKEGRANQQLVALLQQAQAWQPDESIRVLERLEDAVLSFDQAPIYTIHGFCQRVLQQLVFETGSRFGVELLTSEESLADDALRDFIAQRWATDSAPISRWLPFEKPLWEQLRKVVDKALNQPSFAIEPSGQRLDELLSSSVLDDFESQATSLAKVWHQAREPVASQLRQGSAQDIFNKRSFNSGHIEDCLALVDRLLERPSWSAFAAEDQEELEKRLSRLTPDMLVKNTKQAHKSAVPQHPVFALFEALLTASQQVRSVINEIRAELLATAANFVRAKVWHHKQQHGLMSFGDLLHHVDRALQGQLSEALIGSLREKFRVALVDEFQDTDPIQFRIFSRIFLDSPPDSAPSSEPSVEESPTAEPADAEAADALSLAAFASADSFYSDSSEPETTDNAESAPLDEQQRAFVMIGDPKQSIYKFRGADLPSYLAATSRVDADRQHAMDTNWRSDRSLVDAVQQVFQSHPDPFLNSQIPLPSVRAHFNDRLTDEPAFVITFIPRADDIGSDAKITNENALSAVTERVAEEIVRQLNSDLCLPAESGDSRFIEPRDIAVLCRTGFQLREMQAALSQRGVPSVLLTDDSVYVTSEAADVARILQALLSPTSITLMAGALCTPLFGLSAKELDALREADSSVTHWAERFQHWSSLWRHDGFIVMWRHLLETLEALPRLAQQVGGERRITNYLHLGELLHTQASFAHAGPDELVRWFDQTRGDADAAQEETQLRLETDAAAVQLITIHRSKGLEFPIVYCPTLWHQSRDRAPLLVISGYDAQQAARPEPVIDVGSTLFDDRVQWDSEAQQAEDRRLLYVALTRARHQCQVHWIATATSDKSAAGQIFLAGAEAKEPDSQLQTKLENWLSALSVARTAWRVAPSAEQRVAVTQYVPRSQASEQLQAREISHPQIRRYEQTSFTALTKHNARQFGTEWADRDAVPADTGLDPTPRLDSVSDTVPLGGMPGGAQIGDVVHCVLEKVLQQIPHQRPHGETDPRSAVRSVRDLVRNALEYEQTRLMLEARWTEPLIDTLTSCLTQCLPGIEPDLALMNLKRDAFACEMPFVLSLGTNGTGFEMRRLAEALRTSDRSVVRRYADRAAQLGAGVLEGFLVGFIDLLFEWQGRWYVLDYKTNNLGLSSRDYADDRLDTAMFEHDYLLQYHLYVLAVRRFLSDRVPGFDYSRDFGGVAYLFLRAIEPGDQAQRGVYFDRPSPDLIQALDLAF